MPKLFLRIVTLFLVPCLLTDSATAFAPHDPVFHEEGLFTSQALAPTPAAPLNSEDLTPRLMMCQGAAQWNMVSGASLHADPGIIGGRKGPVEMKPNPDEGAILPPGKGPDLEELSERLRLHTRAILETLGRDEKIYGIAIKSMTPQTVQLLRPESFSEIVSVFNELLYFKLFEVVVSSVSCRLTPLGAAMIDFLRARRGNSMSEWSPRTGPAKGNRAPRPKKNRGGLKIMVLWIVGGLVSLGLPFVAAGQTGLGGITPLAVPLLAMGLITLIIGCGAEALLGKFKKVFLIPGMTLGKLKAPRTAQTLAKGA